MDFQLNYLSFTSAILLLVPLGSRPFSSFLAMSPGPWATSLEPWAKTLEIQFGVPNLSRLNNCFIDEFLNLILNVYPAPGCPQVAVQIQPTPSTAGAPTGGDRSKQSGFQRRQKRNGHQKVGRRKTSYVFIRRETCSAISGNYDGPTNCTNITIAEQYLNLIALKLTCDPLPTT